MAKAFICSADNVTDITPEETWNIIRGDRKENYLLLDVRTPQEYEKEHLSGARLIPLNELDKRYRELEAPQKIILYCRSGRRSLAGAILLCNLGFWELYNMEGGIINWPYKKVKGPPEEAEEFFKDIKEIEELLLFAIQMEKTGRIFYLQAAQKMEEKELSGLLKILSQMEERHMENLYLQLKKICPKAPLLKDIKESEFTEGAISLPEALLFVEENPLKEKIDVLEIALENECKAFDLYRRMAEKVRSPLKNFFQDLAEQERGHINELSRLI